MYIFLILYDPNENVFKFLITEYITDLSTFPAVINQKITKFNDKEIDLLSYCYKTDIQAVKKNIKLLCPYCKKYTVAHFMKNQKCHYCSRHAFSYISEPIEEMEWQKWIDMNVPIAKNDGLMKLQ